MLSVSFIDRTIALMTDSSSSRFPVSGADRRRIVVMGVSGSGKSTIGEAVGRKLDIPYLDGDTFHPAANIEKMSRGEPLDDTDRAGWLDTLSELLAEYRRDGRSLLLGCSALKRHYRDRLRRGDPNLLFIFLDGSFDVILRRMRDRQHFFTEDMLQSQFDTLETPDNDEAIRIDIDASFDSVIERSAEAVAQRIEQDTSL